jgi:hypothetical protein
LVQEYLGNEFNENQEKSRLSDRINPKIEAMVVHEFRENGQIP